MNMVETSLSGVWICEPARFRDSRGFFQELYSGPEYGAAGLTLAFVQDGWSRSIRGTLRGLHFQEPRPQGKLVMVTRGTIYDVAVDIRRGSPSFGRWVGVELSDETGRQLWIPPGFAHGFLALSDTVDVLYKFTDFYYSGADAAVAWDDPDLGIEWPLGELSPLLSAKDARAPRLKDAPRLPCYDPAALTSSRT